MSTNSEERKEQATVAVVGAGEWPPSVYLLNGHRAIVGLNDDVNF
jgi:hypothetical protein